MLPDMTSSEPFFGVLEAEFDDVTDVQCYRGLARDTCVDEDEAIS
jgi:hypothetical protein